MKKVSAIASLSFLLIAVLISGCTLPGGNQTGSGQGVIIENFEPDFSRVYAGETFKLQMKARNTGSVDAKGVMPWLYNIKSGGNQNLEISCNEQCTEGFTLLAPDPERGTTGGSRTCIWDCKAPTSIPKGLSVSFNPSVRLYYFYQTSTIKSISIVSQDELRSLQNQGKAPPSDTISTTTSPVQLDVVVNGPIRYWENERILRFPININMMNSGGGVPCALSNLIDYWDKEDYGDEVLIDCENTQNWNKVQIVLDKESGISYYCSGLKENSIVDIWKGQSTTLTCEVEMNVPPTGTAGFIQKNIKVSIKYDYIIDSSTSVEVIGREIPSASAP